MSGPSLALDPGTTIDTLRIDRVLGQGSFGMTYLVTDTVLDKSFVLKEYLPRDQVRRGADGRLQPAEAGTADQFAAGLQMFLDQSRTVAGLEHPNIVRILRCLEANGTAYVVMPWYRGQALHTLLQRGGTFAQDEALALARPLFDALDHMHRHGVIHRDIKPANIYITESGEPILMDFGAAGLGSPGYAAIEQSSGEDEIGPWTDVYGLAATLYRCIGGRVPAAATERNAARKRRDPDPLTPLSALVAPQDFGTLLRAVHHGLAINPADRPRSMAEWRGEFPELSAAGAETEDREWLPLILLAIFLALLAAAIAYLVIGGDPDRPNAGETATAPATPPPSKPVDHASPEETRRWQASLEADTLFAYRLFLEDFPQSIHRDQALLHLERLDHQAWGRAQADGTRPAIDAYLEDFPDGLHLADARVALDALRQAEAAAERARKEREGQEFEAWEQARAQRSLDAVDGFLDAWPQGLHADDARALRRQILDEINERKAFEAARALGTIDAYQSYIDAFPRGARVAAALQAIDDLTLRPGKVFRDCDRCPTLVVLPAGSFWQGSEEGAPDALRMETPRRMVTIAEPFAIGVFEITLEQWDHCVEAGGCSTRPSDNGWGRGDRPVIMVSWNDAQEYVAWLSVQTGESYSLPSESQWEYAARAGEESDWLGGAPALVCEFGNIAGAETGFRWQHAECADAAALETLPVGSLRANAFGLHDVIGNVAEWTLDCMNLSYLDAPADGSAWSRGLCSSRMTRGGSWFTGSREIRLPARFNLKNGDRNDFTGLRVVRRIEQ
jgi:formylglycine-generating enzyme required for sulfatase activity/serine/threonine protein kinase